MTECYICHEDIDDGQWVVPLETYRARYRGDDDEVVLDADDTVETLVHLDCLTETAEDWTNGGDRDAN